MFNKTYTDMDTIYCKMTESSTGEYVNSEGVRCNIDWGHHIEGPDGRANEELGYIPFSSIADAEQYFRVTKAKKQ